MRAWRADDLVPFAQLNADPEVMRYMPALLTREESDLFAARIGARMAEEGFGAWAVERLGHREFLGFVGLNRVANDMPCAPAVEIGWRLKREAWGHGYATEAAIAACEDGFGRVGLGEIIAFTSDGNLRSSKVMERLGMVRDPASDFEHPRVPAESPLGTQRVYRLARQAFANG